MIAARLEPREPHPPALALSRERIEPVAVGTLGVAHGLLERGVRDLGEPRSLGGELGPGRHVLHRLRERDLAVPALLSEVSAASEEVVEDDLGVAERASGGMGLLAYRVRAVPVSLKHVHDSSSVVLLVS